MDKFILSGKVVEAPQQIFSKKQIDESFFLLQTKWGDFSIAIDNYLAPSINIDDYLLIEGQFLQKFIDYDEKRYQICYLSVNNAKKTTCDEKKNFVKFNAKVNKQVWVCGQISLIFAHLIDKDIPIEIEFDKCKTFDDNIFVQGTLSPKFIDKLGLMEYIINSENISEINMYQERE